MTKEVFLQEIIPLIQELIPAGYRVVEKTQLKNNGTIRSGITLLKETGRGTFPFVYIDPLLKSFEEGKELLSIAEEAAQKLMKKPPADPFCGKTPTESELLERVVFRLVSHDRNEDFLKEIVNRDFLDLSLLYGLYSENEAGESTVFFMKKQFLSDYDINEEALFAAAFRNCIRYFGEEVEGVHERILPQEGDEWIYVLSNRQRLYGAAVMIYGSSLRALAEEKQRDILILPSSIHELIVTPLEETPYDFLPILIKSVNDGSTAPEDVLSDHAYVYRKDTDRIEIYL